MKRKATKGPKPVVFPGDKYNELVVICELPQRSRSGHRWYLCKCSCSNFTRVPTNNLRSGMTKSCGHLLYKNKIKPKIKPKSKSKRKPKPKRKEQQTRTVITMDYLDAAAHRWPLEEQVCARCSDVFQNRNIGGTHGPTHPKLCPRCSRSARPTARKSKMREDADSAMGDYVRTPSGLVAKIVTTHVRAGKPITLLYEIGQYTVHETASDKDLQDRGLLPANTLLDTVRETGVKEDPYA